jgi:peptide/nickel transport system permease protein
VTTLVARRLVAFLLTLLAASLVVFFVLEVLPGDPAVLMLGTGARADTLAALRHHLGLDLPFWLRYLGVSTTYSVPVADLVAQRVLVSLPLAVMGIVLSTAIAIPVGVLAASHRGTATDAGLMGVAQLGVAVPNFWLGILLILLFSIGLGWLPAGGFPGWNQGWWPALRSLLLPSLALALPQAAILARVTRASVIEAMGEDFMRTARAKGLTRNAAIWRHAVPNALIPIVTIIGMQFSFLLAGTVIIENVFTLPGLGRLVFQAIEQRDLIVVEDLVVMLASCVITVNFLVDIAYAVLDPRLRKRSP